MSAPNVSIPFVKANDHGLIYRGMFGGITESKFDTVFQVFASTTDHQAFKIRTDFESKQYRPEDRDFISMLSRIASGSIVDVHVGVGKNGLYAVSVSEVGAK